MSSEHDFGPSQRKSPPRKDEERRERIQGASYEVGYGKPPQHSRFEKGQSGNSRGRPRKIKRRRPRLSDAPMDAFLDEEAYRTLSLRENGKPTELTAAQAVLRSMFTGAIKGNRLSQKFVIQYMEEKELLHLEAKLERYVRLETIKRKGEATITECKQKGLPLPELLPHPDDIVLNPVTYDANVHGPKSKDDLHFFGHTVSLRDHCMLRAAHNEKLNKCRPSDNNGKICAYLFFAQFFDACLPSRYRWADGADLALLMKYMGIPKRERAQRILSETDHLRRTAPPSIYTTPEMQKEFGKIIKQVFKVDPSPS